jgi:hypothetical protein
MDEGVPFDGDVQNFVLIEDNLPTGIWSGSDLLQFYGNSRKRKLADKVLKGKKLNNEEKEEIYTLLTGEEPEGLRRRGRPSTVSRDLNMAYDYLIEKEKGTKGPHRVIKKKYKLTINDNAFYMALNRGCDTLSAMAEDYKKKRCKDTKSGDDANEMECKRILRLLENYRSN